MEIKSTKNETELTVCPIGRLETVTAPDLQAFIDENISGVTDLTFDMKELEYISSAGLRVLLSAHKVFAKKNGMTITNVGEMVMDVFEVTGFKDILSIR